MIEGIFAVLYVSHKGLTHCYKTVVSLHLSEKMTCILCDRSTEIDSCMQTNICSPLQLCFERGIQHFPYITDQYEDLKLNDQKMLYKHHSYRIKFIKILSCQELTSFVD